MIPSRLDFIGGKFSILYKVISYLFTHLKISTKKTDGLLLSRKERQISAPKRRHGTYCFTKKPNITYRRNQARDHSEVTRTMGAWCTPLDRVWASPRNMTGHSENSRVTWPKYWLGSYIYGEGCSELRHKAVRFIRKVVVSWSNAY